MEYKDKVLHFVICFVLGLISPIFALGIALGKEYIDSRTLNNHWCWYDMLANISGILLAVIINLSI